MRRNMLTVQATLLAILLQGSMGLDLTFVCTSFRTITLSFPANDADLGGYSYVTLISETCGQSSTAFTVTTTKTATILCAEGALEPFETHTVAFHTESKGLQHTDTFVDLICSSEVTIPSTPHVVNKPPIIAAIEDEVTAEITVQIRSGTTAAVTSTVGDQLNALLTLDSAFHGFYRMFLREVRAGTPASPDLYTVIENGCPNTLGQGFIGVPANGDGTATMAATSIVTDFKAFIPVQAGTEVAATQTVSLKFIVDLCLLSDLATCFTGNAVCDTDTDGSPDALTYGRRKKREDAIARGELEEREVILSLPVFQTKEEEIAFRDNLLNNVRDSKQPDDATVCTKKSVIAVTLALPVVGMIVCILGTFHLYTMLQGTKTRTRGTSGTMTSQRTSVVSFGNQM